MRSAPFRSTSAPSCWREENRCCDGVLLPGSKADVDPAKFNAARSGHTALADPRRDAVDDLLLQDAYRLRKPVLGICYGLQTLNVFRGGSLVQHIPELVPQGAVDHEAGRNVAVAHRVEIEVGSKLARVVGGESTSGAKAQMNQAGKIAALKALRHPKAEHDAAATLEGQAVDKSPGLTVDTSPGQAPPLVVGVNSSHHQSADSVGDGLRVVARCPDDGIVEALEGTSPDHFVLAVQWHPERSVDEDAGSRAVFRAFIEAAGQGKAGQGKQSAAQKSEGE
jgi:putative glutamine amidotransferase